LRTTWEGKKILFKSVGGVKAIGVLERGKREKVPIYKFKKKVESYENPLRTARGNFINWSIFTIVTERSEKILGNLILIDF